LLHEGAFLRDGHRKSQRRKRKAKYARGRNLIEISGQEEKDGCGKCERGAGQHMVGFVLRDGPLVGGGGGRLWKK